MRVGGRLDVDTTEAEGSGNNNNNNSSSSSSRRRSSSAPVPLAQPLCGTRQKNGKLCPNRVRMVGEKCGIHRPKSKPWAGHKLSADGPRIEDDWATNYLLENVTEPVMKAARVKARMAASRVANDRPGWIYVYRLADDGSNFFWKIGRTGQPNVRDRVAQWPGAIPCMEVRVPFNQLAEDLIFAVLYTVRVTRYVFPSPTRTSGKEFLTLTVSRPPRFVVDDAYNLIMSDGLTYAQMEPFPPALIRAIRSGHGRLPLAGVKKELEWFFCDYNIVAVVVARIAAALNAWEVQKK